MNQTIVLEIEKKFNSKIIYKPSFSRLLSGICVRTICYVDEKKLMKVGVVLLACLGSALIICTLALVTLFLTLESRSVEAYLPANTDVFVLHPTADILPHISMLSGVNTGSASTIENLYALAVIDGKVLRIVKDTELDSLAAYEHVTIPPYTFYGQDTSVLNNPQSPSLAKDPVYKELNRQHAPGQTWMYIREVPEPTSTTDALLHGMLFGNSPAISIGLQGDMLAIHRLRSLGSYHSIEPTNVQLADVSLSLHTRNLPELLQIATKRLDATQRAVLLSLLQEKFTTSMDAALSLQYDVLPLLGNETSIATSSTASGNTLLFVHGMHDDADELSAIIARLFESTLSQKPQTTITERVLDDRFNARDIRVVETDISVDAIKVEGWKVLTASLEQDSSIVMAQKEEEFIISNIPGIIEQLPELQTPLPFETSIVSNTLVAGGSIDATLLNTALNAVETATGTTLRNLIPQSAMHWTLSVSGKSEVLEFQ